MRQQVLRAARRVLIDTDPGVDDALALLLAFACPEIRIEAITIVAGNVDAELATRNALLTIDAAELEHPPLVMPGARKPLERPAVNAIHVHGDDGLGGTATAYGEPAHAATAGSVPDLMLETISRHPREVTIVALGPLTNVAQAVLSDPATMALAERIVIMGGAFAAPGNATPVAEFNFFADPEAARVVLGSGAPVTVVGLDATRQATVERDELAGRAKRSTKPGAAFAERITRRYFDIREERTGRADCFLHDPLALAVALDPSFVRTERRFLNVETEGRLTTGMVVADRREGARRPSSNEGVEVALGVESERFRRFFLDRLFG